MRAFYKLPVAAWDVPPSTPDKPGPQRPGDGVEVSRSGATVYVFSSCDPNPALEAAGGKRLGARLSEFKAADQDRFTVTPVRVAGAEGEEDTVQSVPTWTVKDETAVVGEATLAMLFSGDDPADLL